jgi:phosphatidate cytidylyltransferase
MPGVDSGLVGFEDVTGATADSEEDYEAREQAASSDLAMRVGSAVVIFGLFLGSLFLGGWWFTSFVILAMVVATGEFYATVRHAGYRPLALFGLLGVVFMGVGAHVTGVVAIGAWAALIAAGSVLFFSLSPRRQPLEDAGVTVGAMAWVGLLSFAILIAAGPRPLEHILFTVLLVASNDTGAYFIGRAFGRRKLAPVLSPQKTIEGFFGGFLAGLVMASILVTFPGWEDIGLAKGLVAAALVGVIAPIGDAAESMVKRALRVKDMGSVLPGHGGILDRIDSFLFAIPAIYFLFRGFGLL